MEFKYIAMLICLIFSIFLVAIEIRRAGKARLVWRISASILAIASFLLFIVPLQYEVETEDSSNELILLTPGTNPDSLKNLDTKPVVATDAAVASETRKEHVPDLFYYLQSHPEVKNIGVYGYGLKEEDLKKLSGYHLTFHSSSAPQGVLSCHWNQEVKSTDLLKVRGTYNNIRNQPIRLILSGFGSNLDSVVIQPKTKTTFHLKTQPKQIGKAVFKLVALQDQDTLKAEPVPFEVSDASKVKVLFLASYPDFEYKFLSNWLYEKQYPLAFRSRISKDKYSTEFSNRERVNLSSLSADLLSKFDLLLVDEEELAMLSPQEIKSVNANVAKGMGLFVRKTDINSKASTPNRTKYFVDSAGKEKHDLIGFKDQDINFRQKLEDQELYISARPNDRPMVTDAQNKVLVNSTLYGSGTVITSTIPATYQWLLNGDAGSYTTFWSTLIAKASKKESSVFSWKIFPQYPLARTKTRILVDQSSSTAQPKLAFNDQHLSPRQNTELPFRWDAIGWPEKEGWNTLQINRQKASFYVYKKGDWQDSRNYMLIKASEQFSGHLQNHKDVSISPKTQFKTVSSWYYYVVFLISAGYLWYESRILSRKT